MRLKLEFKDIPATHLDEALTIYRKTTIGFLRKYFRMATELGHLPSLLGREFFRSHVTSYNTFSFEDAVIFTHDVERCLERLPKRLQVVIARMVFQEHTYEETAQLTGWAERSVYRWYGEALDRLADVFVRYGLMEPIKLTQAIQVARELGLLGEEAIPREVENAEESKLPPKKPCTRARADRAPAAVKWG